jgi:hypothetical protein
MTTTITPGTRIEVTCDRHVASGRQGTVSEIRTTDGTEYANGTEVWVRFDDDTTGFFAIEQVQPALPPATERRDLLARLETILPVGASLAPEDQDYPEARRICARLNTLDERMRAKHFYWSSELDRYVPVPRA